MFTASTRTTPWPNSNPGREGSTHRSSLWRISTALVGGTALTLALGACGGGSASPGASRASNTAPLASTPTAPAPTSSLPAGSSVTSGEVAAPKALVIGSHSASLDFPVEATQQGATAPNPFSTTTTPRPTARTAKSPADAAERLLRAVVARDSTLAWAELNDAERNKLGYSQRLIDDVAGFGWKSFAITDTAGDTVTADVVQTPRISDIDGVVATRARVTLTVSDDQGRYSVQWSRRRVEQMYPERSSATDQQVKQSVLEWATSRQNCEPGIHEHSGGLLGVVGLATALCHTTGNPTIGTIGDLDSLDEPQPVLDAFGGSALLWARIVPLAGPVPMNIVVAPDGDSWSVVGVARSSLSTS